MSTPLSRPATMDGLFLWVLHRFAEAFEEHAVVKGGIGLRLLDCPRFTNDIDYVFVPYRSKNEVRARLERVLREIDGARVDVAVHSKMIRATLQVDAARIQIEANVSTHCATVPMSTAGLARPLGQLPRIVRMMAPDAALAHKLAAWNERRLLRDLYDAYFLAVRAGASVDMGVLTSRLARIESRHPEIGGRKKMTIVQFAAALRTAAETVDERTVNEQLAPLLPPEDIAGLVPRLRSALLGLVDRLATAK